MIGDVQGFDAPGGDRVHASQYDAKRTDYMFEAVTATRLVDCETRALRYGSWSMNHCHDAKGSWQMVMRDLAVLSAVGTDYRIPTPWYAVTFNKVGVVGTLVMSDQHVYDDEQAERLAAIYTAPATVERRQWILDHLDLAGGESVLSIGCGPGHEPAAIAKQVGETGHVHGIDNSEDVVAMAHDHCDEFPQVTITHADATELEVGDASFDAAIASLVYEYSPEVDTALAELYRALTPGGRAAVLAADWDSTVWHSSDPDRMDRAIEAWKDVYANPHLGSKLTTYVDETDFTIEQVAANSYLETDLDTYAGFLLELIKGHLEEETAIDQTVIDDWEHDLREIDEAGETFFSLTYYLYMVTKPD